MIVSSDSGLEQVRLFLRGCERLAHCAVHLHYDVGSA